MRLQIKKLFDEKDFDLKFNENLTILIGENGCGKSTILKILNYIFKQDFISLSTIPFDEITLTFPVNDVVKKYENGIGKQIDNLKVKIKYSEIAQLDCVKDAKFRIIFKSFLDEYDYDRDINNCKFDFDRFWEELLSKFKKEKSNIYSDVPLNINIIDDLRIFFGWNGENVDYLRTLRNMDSNTYSKAEYNSIWYLNYFDRIYPVYGSLIYFYGIYLTMIRIKIMENLDFTGIQYKIPLYHEGEKEVLKFGWIKLDRDFIDEFMSNDYVLDERYDEEWLQEYYDCFLIKLKDKKRTVSNICYKIFNDEVKQKQFDMMFSKFYLEYDTILYLVNGQIKYDDYVTFNEEIKYSVTLLTRESYVKLVKHLANPINLLSEEGFALNPVFERDYKGVELEKIKLVLNVINLNKRKYELTELEKTIDDHWCESINVKDAKKISHSIVEKHKMESPEDFIVSMSEDINLLFASPNEVTDAWFNATIYDGKRIIDKILNLNIKDFQDARPAKVFYELTERYFVNKIFLLDYDKEGNILVRIFDKRNGLPIEENMLSSGEYKILRIIKVLAFCENNNIYLFDEPELSLSIYWQSMLLDDFLKYGKKFKTIVATQSPHLVDETKIKYLLEVNGNE